ncbi:MAG: M20 family metallopeptidase, partial [Proteobacteria bacterium]|nr:M20 family metallopeptidase [Pseudomonadota bacterium]
NKLVLSYLSEQLGNEVEIKELFSGSALSTDHENPWVNQTYEIIEGITNCPQSPIAGTYFTDASCLTPAMGSPPTIILGPGESEMAHKTDEYCHIANIEQSLEIYSEIIDRWE